MDDDELELPGSGAFPGSRPSGILESKGGFGLGKFLAITAGLAAAGGVGALTYRLLEGREPPPAPPAVSPPAPAPEPEPAPEPAKEPPAPPPARMDLGGPMRLDIPDPQWDDPNDAPAPGPQVETPDW